MKIRWDGSVVRKRVIVHQLLNFCYYFNNEIACNMWIFFAEILTNHLYPKIVCFRSLLSFFSHVLKSSSFSTLWTAGTYYIWLDYLIYLSAFGQKIWRLYNYSILGFCIIYKNFNQLLLLFTWFGGLSTSVTNVELRSTNPENLTTYIN